MVTYLSLTVLSGPEVYFPGRSGAMTQTAQFPFTIDDAIRRARLDADLTPKEVALGIGCAYRTVLRWETGEKIPSGRNLARFIQLTGAAWLPEAIEVLRRRSS